MATLLEIVYSIRNMAYGGQSASDSTVSTSQISFWVNTERSKLLKEEFEKNKLMNPRWIQDLGCVPVQCLDKVQCCELNYRSDEFIYRTVNRIPDPTGINWSGLHSNVLLTYVGLATHDQPFEFTAEPIAHWSRYKRFTSNKPRSFYRDGYVYITNIKNPSHLEVINIKGVFEDPEKVAIYNVCNNPDCSEDVEYPIPSHLISPLQQLVYDKWLLPTMRTVTDYINDARENKVQQ
jgi:hypothetical protein